MNLFHPTRLWVARHPVTLLPLVLLVLLLAACGEETGDVAGEGTESDLEGRTFVATSLTGADRDIVPGSTIRLTFTDGRIGASAGCNQMSGDYSVDAGALVVGPIAGTEMGCDQPLMDQDTWLADFLSDGPDLDLAGDALTLAVEGGATLTLAEEVVKDTPLEGTVWFLDSLISSPGDDGAVSSLPLGTSPPTLVFEQGTAQVFTGCNRGTAEVGIGETELTWNGLALTKMMCADEEGVLESEVVAVIGEGVTPWEIDGQRLTITAPDGKTALGFTAVATP